MIKLAVSMPPGKSVGNTLMKQCGVDYAVGGFSLDPIPGAGEDAQPFSRTSLARTKAAYNEAGFTLSVIESRPPMEKIKWVCPVEMKR